MNVAASILPEAPVVEVIAQADDVVALRADIVRLERDLELLASAHAVEAVPKLTSHSEFSPQLQALLVAVRAKEYRLVSTMHEIGRLEVIASDLDTRIESAMELRRKNENVVAIPIESVNSSV